MFRSIHSAVIAAIFVMAVMAHSHSTVSAQQTLDIGSKAPSLDIEHWLQDGNGFFEHVTAFEKDKVYIVEFWATWCGPCIGAMPQLAALQNKYRGRDVQIISVTDESVDQVAALMNQNHPQTNQSFAEITSAYSLTSDPDGSVHDAYMRASNQQGIPVSFIVGKTGLIEWIGHPLELEMPLEAVVTGNWDREKFRKQRKARAGFEVAMQRLAMLAGAERFGDAIKLVEGEIAKAKESDLQDLVEQWVDIRFSLKLSAGQIDDETVAYYRSYLDRIKDEPVLLMRFGYSIYGAYEQGGNLGPLATDVIKAISKSKDRAPAEAKPLMHNVVAQLHASNKDYDLAIASQQMAVDSGQGRQQERFVRFLDELKKMAAAGDEAETPAIKQ